ncbi:MAG: hypothetical protein QOE98_898 [Gaiellaceae bacterium]|nr:hypothetical protein [Gaiellaceae bacterium]
MRLDGWRIDGFGGLAGWQVEALAEHELIVVCGPNESGKSTLREFFATAYFGFAPAQRDLNVFAPEEGPFGGALQLVDADGERLSIERELRSGPRGRVYRATTHDELANRTLPALAGISRRVYLDLHSLGRDDLVRVDASTWQSVEDLLLAGSALAFLRSAADVRRGLDDRAASLWRPDRRGQPEARRLREQIAALRATARDAAASRRRLDDIDADLSAEREREEQLRRAGADLATRLRRHTELAPALAAWRDVERLKAEAAVILPRDDDFPGDPADAVDRRRAEAADAERAATTARRQADQLQAIADVPEATRLLAARAAELRELAAEETGAADLRAAIGAAETAARARRAEADRRAEAVLGRPLEPADRAALDAVRTADLRAAVAAAAAPGRRTPAAVAAIAGLACAVLAVAGLGGRTVPALAAVALLGIASLLARSAQRRTGPSAAAAVGALAVAPSRLARPDAALAGDIDDLRAAVSETEAAAAEAQRLRALVETRSTRLAEALSPLGLSSAGHALAAVDEALIRVAEGRKATGQLPEAVADADRLAGAAVAASGRRDTLLVKLQAVAPGAGLDVAVSAVLTARRLRSAADERLRSANTAFGDLTAIAAEAAELERRGTPLVLDDAALAQLDAERAQNATAIEDLQHRRGALVAERHALAALPGVADAAGEAEVYEELLHTVERRRDRLALASSVLLHAERRFREQHGPGFLAAASRYLAAITGGRYDRLLIGEQSGNEPPKLEVMRHGRPVPVGAPLSRGTLEQIHVALRLALVDEVDPQHLLPLFLDEALVNWDDDRVDGLLPLLAALEGRQAVFTTCHPALAVRLGAVGAAVIATPGLPQQPARVA